jgi:ribose transport system substrate-binding protein
MLFAVQGAPFMPNMVRRSFLCVVMALLLCGPNGCERRDSSITDDGITANKSQTSPPGSASYTIGYSQCNRGEPWREQMDTDIQRHASEHSSIRLIMKDAQNDALTQQAHIKEFIAQRVSLIIISPKDTSLTQAVAEAFQAGIPVIVLDRKVQGDQFTCFIGADNRVIGAAVGRWVIEKLGGRGNVVELKGLGSSTPAIERSEPFHEAIAATDIKIVYEADMEWLGDKAREKMQAALARNPQTGGINLVYGANDPAAIAAYYAAKDAGCEKQMLFVGVDALPQEGIEAVRKGILNATFQYPNGADVAIDTALEVLQGHSAPKTITLGTRLFTPDNVERGGEPVER